MIKRLVFCLLLISACFTHASTFSVPELTSPVTDLAGVLTPAQRNKLTDDLLNFERSRQDGAQIAVLIVKTTGHETIEQAAENVFNQWGLGSKHNNNGILLLIAESDRTLRIEVGSGLEGVIPDVIAGRIIRNAITPEFKEQQYYQGISKGLDFIKGLIEGDPNTQIMISYAPTRLSGDDLKPIIYLYPFAFILTLSFMWVRVRRKNKREEQELLTQLTKAELNKKSSNKKKNKRKLQSLKPHKLSLKRVFWFTLLTQSILTTLFSWLWLGLSLEKASTVGVIALFGSVFIFLFVPILFMSWFTSRSSGRSSRSSESSSYDSSYSSSSSSSDSGYSGGGGSSSGGGSSGRW